MGIGVIYNVSFEFWQSCSLDLDVLTIVTSSVALDVDFKCSQE